MADEIYRDFRAAPVPIRLSCPFSNGIILNYYARAVDCNNRVLRVVSVNPFERELQLVVAAPFFSNLVRCQVVSVARSKRQASNFEVDLRFVDTPVLVSHEVEHKRPRKDPSGTPIMIAGIADAASTLAIALESSTGIPFAKAFEQASDQHPQLKRLALIAATVLLLGEKGLVDSSVVMRNLMPGSPFRNQKLAGAGQSEIGQDRRVG